MTSGRRPLGHLGTYKNRLHRAPAIRENARLALAPQIAHDWGTTQKETDTRSLMAVRSASMPRLVVSKQCCCASRNGTRMPLSQPEGHRGGSARQEGQHGTASRCSSSNI